MAAARMATSHALHVLARIAAAHMRAPICSQSAVLPRQYACATAARSVFTCFSSNTACCTMLAQLQRLANDDDALSNHNHTSTLTAAPNPIYAAGYSGNVYTHIACRLNSSPPLAASLTQWRGARMFCTGSEAHTAGGMKFSVHAIAQWTGQPSLSALARVSQQLLMAVSTRMRDCITRLRCMTHDESAPSGATREFAPHIARLSQLEQQLSQYASAQLQQTVWHSMRAEHSAHELHSMGKHDGGNEQQLTAAVANTVAYFEQFTKECEAALSALQGSLQLAVERRASMRDTQHATCINACMDVLHGWIIAQRLLLSQHRFAWKKLNNTLDKRKDYPAVELQCDVVEMCRLAHEDCRAFCIEKNSTAPATGIARLSNTSGNDKDDVTACVVLPYVEFVYMEVLKNAMQALIDKWGAWDVDEAEPIDVSVRGVVQQGRRMFEIIVHDSGGGMRADTLASLHNYFHTSRPPPVATYGYSRTHGSQFSGYGVGAPLARVYARFMKGDITWTSNGDEGWTRCIITLPADGFEF